MQFLIGLIIFILAEGVIVYSVNQHGKQAGCEQVIVNALEGNYGEVPEQFKAKVAEDIYKECKAALR